MSLLSKWRFEQLGPGWVANSVDPDQMLHSVNSDWGLHYLLRPVCPSSYSTAQVVFQNPVPPPPPPPPEAGGEWTSGKD